MQSSLKSTNHLELAKALTDRFIDIVREGKDGELLADRLEALRDEVWSNNDLKSPVERRKAALHRLDTFRKATENLSHDEKTALIDAYARLGHLYEISALVARGNFFEALREEGKPVPGGVKEFVMGQSDVATAVGKLNQPVFEVVLTMHPTNTSSLEFMKAQRALSLAMETESEEAIVEALRKFAQAPLLPQKKDGNDKNFSVRDETAVVLNYLDNIYDDLPRIYSQYDRTLASASVSNPAFGQYDPLELNLKMRFSSWGSAGDKDGNNNITAENTLEAIAMHTDAIVNHYRRDLNAVLSERVMEGTELAGWKDTLDHAHKELVIIRSEINALRKKTNPSYSNAYLEEGDKYTPQQAAKRFDELSRRLAEIRSELNVVSDRPGDDRDGKPILKFERDLLDAYGQEAVSKRTKQSLLNLVRHVRTFGFSFGKIEYRETSKEYSRVVAAIVQSVMPGYEKLSPEQRAAKLTEWLQAEGNEPCRLRMREEKNIVEKGACRPYQGGAGDEAMPITYHTLKRMELARDFPDMIQDNVLAECGRMEGGTHNTAEVAAQGLTNILEAKFVQRMAEKDGKAPLLGIVPLFEEPDTMKNIDHIMRAAYENEAYKQHLEELRDRNAGKVTQQVQIAHSDNARRSGLLAARAFIHEAHKKIRALNEEMGIQTQFFEGGSISDAYRNGVRAISALVNAFDLHDFTKLTFQGGDLVNYFTSPSSTVRLFNRNIPHSAQRFRQPLGGEWVVNQRNGKLPHEMVGDRVEKDRRVPNPIIDDIAIDALKSTLADYQKEDFKVETMGVILAALDYHAETKAGGKTSRAGERSAKPVAIKNSTVSAPKFIPVDIEKVRTIGFSEAWQQAGIVPSWIGSQYLEGHLAKKTAEKIKELQAKPEARRTPYERSFLEAFEGVDLRNPELTPRHINVFYEKSPSFRDAQDRAAFALAMTDPEALKWLDKRMRILAQQHPDQIGEVAWGYKYLSHIKQTYANAGKLSYAALTGKELPEGDMRPAIAESLDRLSDDITNKTGYRNFLLFLKMKGGLDDRQRSVVHNAADTVMHGRFLAADDPSYGAYKLRAKKEAMVETMAR